MGNRIHFNCSVCLEALADPDATQMAIAIRDSGRPNEAGNDEWSLLQVCPEQLGMNDAARRSLNESRWLNDVVRSLPGGANARGIVDVPQVHDDRFSIAEWHERDVARSVAYQGSSKSYDLDGDKILMHYPRVVTLPIPNEGRTTLQCSRGHKSLTTRAALVKAARKAFDKCETSVAIGFVKVRRDSKPVIDAGRSVGAPWALRGR
jgi:hypothetical protein